MITICVPTPLSKTRAPDLSYIVSAAESVAAHLRPGQLIVLQSTTHPGTTEEIVLPILERAGGKVGEDFFLGYAPERVDPGNEQYTMRNTPKLIAGVTASAAAASSCSTARSSTSWSRSRARWSPRPRSCTRTPSGRSTSASPTSWR